MPSKKGTSTAEGLIPPKPTLRSVREAAADCKACDLWKTGTQTVFGEGSRNAEIMFVGEQPGNEEDLTGKPFVGPAGKLLDKALLAAGIDRTRTYVTNVVKHFKWIPKGKLRIHGKPNAVEIAACSPWLKSEIALVKPKLIVCLGATAAQALLGKQFRVTQHRGEFFDFEFVGKITATVHPSSILRAYDEQSRKIEMQRFIEDLSTIAAFLEKEALTST
jgi:DNA polymerase